MKKFLTITMLFIFTSFHEITFAKNDYKKIADSQLFSQKNKTSIKLLNQLLADETILLMQTLNYHWNLVGPEFHDYHLLFDKQYNQLFADMDKIAERIRAVQGEALGSLKQILASATLKEDTSKIPTPKQMVINLLSQYEKLIEQIRASILEIDKKTTDVGTVNFLQELIMQHEKTAWMLKSLTE